MLEATPLIAFEDVSFSYPGGPAPLVNASFAILPGRRIALRGSNGSGKSSLLHLVVGLLKPDSGTIRVFGVIRRREADFHEVRARVGLLFQNADDQLFCPTVLEDVAFGPLNLGKSPEEAHALATETLVRVGLERFGDRITYRLSGGEKRLVALATVLAMEPRILLLDEPVAGLDEDAAARITDILEGIPNEMVVVSHDREFLGRVTNGSLRLENGRLTPADPS